MKEAILISSNMDRERGLFQWLSETLKKQNNKIHLHVMNSRSLEKSYVCSSEKSNPRKRTLTLGHGPILSEHDRRHSQMSCLLA